MSDLNTGMVEKYRNDFLKEVEANVEQGDWVKMCNAVWCVLRLMSPGGRLGSSTTRIIYDDSCR